MSAVLHMKVGTLTRLVCAKGWIEAGEIDLVIHTTRHESVGHNE